MNQFEIGKKLFDKTMGLVQRPLDIRAARHQVISGNIANVETPDCVSKRLPFQKVFERFLEGPSVLPLKRTHSRHLPAQEEERTDFSREIEVAPNPGVDIDQQMANLAAHFSLRQAQKITLVTIDTYRIGAVDQLKTYARILGLPLEIATGREEFQEILWSNRDRDWVLVDTAGRNPYSQEQLEELKGILSADPRVQNHLVLSATTKDLDLAQVVERFSLLPIRSYIFTKLDETDEYTSLFNQLLRFKRPLSYLTSGQKVPEDIELASKGKVASLVLNRIPWN